MGIEAGHAVQPADGDVDAAGQRRKFLGWDVAVFSLNRFQLFKDQIRAPGAPSDVGPRHRADVGQTRTYNKPRRGGLWAAPVFVSGARKR